MHLILVAIIVVLGALYIPTIKVSSSSAPPTTTISTADYQVNTNSSGVVTNSGYLDDEFFVYFPLDCFSNSSTTETDTPTSTSVDGKVTSTEQTTEKSTTEQTTEKLTTEQTTEKSTTVKTTEKLTTEKTTEKPTTEQLTEESTIETTTVKYNPSDDVFPDSFVSLETPVATLKQKSCDIKTGKLLNSTVGTRFNDGPKDFLVNVWRGLLPIGEPFTLSKEKQLEAIGKGFPYDQLCVDRLIANMSYIYMVEFEDGSSDDIICAFYNINTTPLIQKASFAYEQNLIMRIHKVHDAIRVCDDQNNCQNLVRADAAISKALPPVAKSGLD